MLLSAVKALLGHLLEVLKIAVGVYVLLWALVGIAWLQDWLWRWL
jgi:hypothetical protein